MLSIVHIIPLMAVYKSTTVMEGDFGSFKQENLCIQGVSHDIMSPSFTAVYIIPLYKLLIYPYVRH